MVDNAKYAYRVKTSPAEGRRSGYVLERVAVNEEKETFFSEVKAGNVLMRKESDGSEKYYRITEVRAGLKGTTLIRIKEESTNKDVEPIVGLVGESLESRGYAVINEGMIPG
jgi:hypothetical protein